MLLGCIGDDVTGPGDLANTVAKGAGAVAAALAAEHEAGHRHIVVDATRDEETARLAILLRGCDATILTGKQVGSLVTKFDVEWGD